MVFTGTNRSRPTSIVPGALEDLDRRAHRGLDLDHLGGGGVAGVDVLDVADQRQAEDAAADVERLAHRDQVEPQVVGRAVAVPVEVGQRLLVLRQRLRGLAQHDPAVAACGARSGRPCGPRRYGARPRSRTAHRSRRTSRPPARRAWRRGCRSWRRTRSGSRRRSAGRAGRCRAARCRGRRGRAGTTRGRGPWASDTGDRSFASSLGSLFCRNSSGSPSTARSS